jgi:hypothetical protein
MKERARLHALEVRIEDEAFVLSNRSDTVLGRINFDGTIEATAGFEYDVKVIALVKWSDPPWEGEDAL